MIIHTLSRFCDTDTDRTSRCFLQLSTTRHCHPYRSTQYGVMLLCCVVTLTISCTLGRLSCSSSALRLACLSLQYSISASGPLPFGAEFNCTSIACQKISHHHHNTKAILSFMAACMIQRSVNPRV